MLFSKVVIHIMIEEFATSVVISITKCLTDTHH